MKDDSYAHLHVLPFEDNLFWEKVEFSDTCWIWTASTNGNGYPTYSKWRLNRYAHRYSYEMAYGEIEEGMEIDHTCFTTLCVRPDHLEQVTHLENIRRSAERITHCPSGHEYSAGNTIVYTQPSTGWTMRKCKECSRIRHIRASRLKGIRKQGTYSLSVSEKQIEQIRGLLETTKMSQREIGEIVGVSQTYVSQVKLGKVKWCNDQ